MKGFLQNALASTKGVSDCAHKHTQDINELVIQYHSPDKVIFCIACNLTTRSLDENAKLRTISGKMSALNIIKYFVKLESTRKKSLIVALFLSPHKQLQMEIENTELKIINIEKY